MCVRHMLYIARCWDMCSDIYRRGEPEHVNDNIYNLSLCPKAETCDGAPAGPLILYMLACQKQMYI